MKTIIIGFIFSIIGLSILSLAGVLAFQTASIFILGFVLGVLSEVINIRL